MKIIYLIFLLLMTSIVSSLITSYLPSFKTVLKRIIMWFKHKPREVVNNDLDARLTRLEILWDRRENDRKTKVQKQVLEYLKELQNGK